MTNEEAIKLIDDRMCFGRGKWSEHHRPVIDEYWQAGEMAIKALEAEPHWIPVTEEPPEVGKSVLICDADGDICLGHRTNYGGYFPDFCEDKIKNVRAWMPLPEPYKGVTDGDD